MSIVYCVLCIVAGLTSFLDMSTGIPENFSGIFPANFLTKNSEETTGPKGRRGSKGEPAVPPTSAAYKIGSYTPS